MNINLVNVLNMLFDVTKYDTEKPYACIYNRVKELATEATAITKDELSSKMTLEHIAAMHVLGAVWELNHYIDVIGVYSNDEITRNEFEICCDLETLSKRGLFSNSNIPLEEIEAAGIDIPECMKKYVNNK